MKPLKALTAEDIAAVDDSSAPPPTREDIENAFAAGYQLRDWQARWHEVFTRGARLVPEWARKRLESARRRKGGAVTARRRSAEAARWKAKARAMDAEDGRTGES